MTSGSVVGYLLDTSVTSSIWDTGHAAHYATLARIVRELGAADILMISVITLGETEYGIASGKLDPARAAIIRSAAQSHRVVLPITKSISATYGQLRGALYDTYAVGRKQRKARPETLVDSVTSQTLGIQENDLWLYSTAITHNLVFVTRDAKTSRIADVATNVFPYYTVAPLVWPPDRGELPDTGTKSDVRN